MQVDLVVDEIKIGTLNQEEVIFLEVLVGRRLREYENETVLEPYMATVYSTAIRRAKSILATLAKITGGR